MKSFLKSGVLTFGIVGVILTSLAPASAERVVRDHRDTPVVRDHRDNAPVVRDHRADPPRQATQGGVTVTSRPRPPKCLGNLCGKKICIGPLCT
ncbi:hypothetical protein [Bradyrhizobium sp. DOA1]|uniref:hypothetical protein n=1 Tax=Bradyrhizobium sp. DOA1 TaxID=1126616 RepID=UPI00077CBE60|nr:hypothetical protein [Bradyrhizobium sp. DOA1]KYG99171.1 hypothetical protein SE91_12220 [Bradyrhizobium sp. DOA1]